MIKRIDDLEYSFTEPEDDYKEVLVHCSLPSRVLRYYELDRYDVAVRFYNNGKVSVYLYDYDMEDYRLEIAFRSGVKDKLIKFAQGFIEE